MRTRLPRELRKFLAAWDTKPPISDLLSHVYFYVTAEDPESAAYLTAERRDPSDIILSPHNHLSVGGLSRDGWEGRFAYGTGSDGLSSIDEMISANLAAGTNILCVTDHAFSINPVTGEELPIPYGIGLGKGAVRRFNELKAAGKIDREDFFVLGGVELEIGERGRDIVGKHLVAIGADYPDFLPIFRELDNGFSYSEDPLEMHEQLCEMTARAGFDRLSKGLRAREDLLVISPHPYLPFAGNPRGRAAGDAVERINFDASSLSFLEDDLREEIRYDRSRALTSYIGILPAIVGERVGGPAEVFSTDAHMADVAGFVRTFVGDIDLSRYRELENPEREIVIDLKRAIRAGKAYGGLNPEYFGPDGMTPAAREINGRYFESRVRRNYETIGRGLRRVAEMISLPIELARSAYQKAAARNPAIREQFEDFGIGTMRIPAKLYDISRQDA